MKELIRFLGYTAATLTMIFVVMGIAKAGVSANTLVYSAIFIVIVLPIAIGIWMAGREKQKANT